MYLIYLFEFHIKYLIIIVKIILNLLNDFMLINSNYCVKIIINARLKRPSCEHCHITPHTFYKLQSSIAFSAPTFIQYFIHGFK